MTGYYQDLKTYWDLLASRRRDSAIIKGIQELLIAFVGAYRPRLPVVQTTTIPQLIDDSSLSALDEEIAAMQQATGAVLAGALPVGNQATATTAGGVGLSEGGEDGV